MNLADSTRSMLAWLRPSPQESPDTLGASCPLLVLGRARLSEAEAAYVVDLSRRYRPVTATDVGVEITRVLDALPHPDDVTTVLRLLGAAR